MQTRIKVVTDGNGHSNYYPQYFHKGWFKDRWITFPEARTLAWESFNNKTTAIMFIKSLSTNTTYLYS